MCMWCMQLSIVSRCERADPLADHSLRDGHRIIYIVLDCVKDVRVCYPCKHIIYSIHIYYVLIINAHTNTRIHNVTSSYVYYIVRSELYILCLTSAKDNSKSTKSQKVPGLSKQNRAEPFEFFLSWGKPFLMRSVSNSGWVGSLVVLRFVVMLWVVFVRVV